MDETVIWLDENDGWARTYPGKIDFTGEITAKFCKVSTGCPIACDRNII